MVELRGRSLGAAVDAIDRPGTGIVKRRWVCWPTSLQVVALLIVAASPVACSEDGTIMVRFEEHGGGMVSHHSTLELRDDGLLQLSRRAPSGALIDRRRSETPPDRLQHYFALLDEGRYLSGSPQEIRSESVSAMLGDFKDVPVIKVEIYRGDSLVASTTVPPPIAGRLRPELREVPFVRIAWELFAELDSRWDSAERVDP